MTREPTGPTGPGSPGGGSTTVILLRHARSAANGSGTLAGRTPGVGLDEAGARQAAAIPQRLAGVPLAALVSSPLQRCQDTLAPLAETTGLPVTLDDRFCEVDYGDWTGRPLSDLVSEPDWAAVQQHPSAAVFPAGEGLAHMAARAVAGIRTVLGEHPGATVLVCSHADVIKAVLADALGLHLDGFQRIVVAPASISVVRYTRLRPFVERINDTGDLAGSLAPQLDHAAAPSPPGRDDSDAVPGGVRQ